MNEKVKVYRMNQVFFNFCLAVAANSVLFYREHYLPNRGGVTVLFGIKVATLHYLGRVVWSVKQAISSINTCNTLLNLSLPKLFVTLHSVSIASDRD